MAVQEFVPVARELEKNWTRFSPHYIVWVCPWVYRQSDECKSQCIHEGRYCTPDPDGDLENGYTGADVVQVSHCVHCCTLIERFMKCKRCTLFARILSWHLLLLWVNVTVGRHCLPCIAWPVAWSHAPDSHMAKAVTWPDTHMALTVTWPRQSDDHGSHMAWQSHGLSVTTACMVV